MKALQIELTRILVANSAKPKTKKARMIEHFFLLGYLFERGAVSKEVHYCVMSGQSIMTIDTQDAKTVKQPVAVEWSAKME